MATSTKRGNTDEPNNSVDDNDVKKIKTIDATDVINKMKSSIGMIKTNKQNIQILTTNIDLFDQTLQKLAEKIDSMIKVNKEYEETVKALSSSNQPVFTKY